MRSQRAVRLVGYDPGTITTDRSAGGQRPGWAKIREEWLGDGIRMTEMTPTPLSDYFEGPPQRLDPPCPAPPGGWPAGTGKVLKGLGSRAVMADHVVDTTTFHPRPESVVLAVTTTDVEAVEHELKPVLGDQLCIVHSCWGRPQLETVRQYLRVHWREWGLTFFGLDTDDRAQTTVKAELLRVLPEMAQWAAGLPAGILTLEPGLRPTALLPRQQESE